MYLKHLTLKHIKRFDNFELSFLRENGEPRKVTVLIGENGTGKSTILQMIALAAAGDKKLSGLVDSSWVGCFADQRAGKATAEPECNVLFGFSLNEKRFYPKWTLEDGRFAGESPPDVRATVRLRGTNTLESMDKYEPTHEGQPSYILQYPIVEVRASDTSDWFVIGYGTNRFISTASGEKIPSGYSTDRLKPLFPKSEGFGSTLTSLKFMDHFAEDKALRNQFVKTLNSVLQEIRLFEELERIEPRGQGGIRNTDTLVMGNRFKIKMGEEVIKLPAIALSHGFQSSIAWISDLVGHLMLDGQHDPKLAEGIVLIDEIDLYLHPPRQVELIWALKKVFPRLQFVVTTHSPLVLCGLDPEEDMVVRLESDAQGNVVQAQEKLEDPRLLTGGELLQEYFKIDDIHPNKAHKLLREFVYLANNPYRTSADDKKLDRWARQLTKDGVGFLDQRVDRKPR